MFGWIKFSTLKARINHVARDDEGASAILIAGTMTFMLAMGTMAVDAGIMMLQDRKIQNIADIAALAASRDLARADEIVARSLEDNGYSADDIDQIETGSFDPRRPLGARFVPGGGGNAVRVTLRRDVDLYFMPIVSDMTTVTVGASAVVTNIEEGAFSATTGLADLEAGVLNALLSSALGTSVSLTLADYRGLAQTDIQALGFLDALAANVGVSAGTYNDLLGAQASVGQIVDAMVSVLNAEQSLDSNGVTVLSALETLSADARALNALTFTISDLLDLGALGLTEIGSTGYVSNLTAGIVAMDLLFQSLYSGKMGEIMDLGVALTVPGVADISVRLAVGEPLQGDPSNPQARIVIGPVGSQVHTAPVRLQLTIGLLQLLSIPGSGNQLINIPLYAEIAGGDAELVSIGCGLNPGADSRLGIRASAGAADIFVGEVNGGAMENFDRTVTVRDAVLINLPLVLRLRAAAQVTIDGAGPQTLSFSAAEMNVPTTKRVGSALSLESTFSTLISTLSIDIDRGVLAILSPLIKVLETVVIQPLLNLLASVSSAIDPALAGLLRALGVSAGYIDVTAYGARCGLPNLVE